MLRSKPFLSTLLTVSAASWLPLAAAVNYNPSIPQLAFAAEELNEVVPGSTTVNLVINPSASGSSKAESYRIAISGSTITVSGQDANGAMYGGFEVADAFILGRPVVNVTREPFMDNRGIKFNIPLDARCPSYDDSGHASNENIINMWDFEGFWEPYLDGLARHRYNAIQLWTTNPYPHMVKLNGRFSDIYEEDVYKAVYDPDPHSTFNRDYTGGLKFNSLGKWPANSWDWNEGASGEERNGYLDIDDDGDLDENDLVVKILDLTIDEKIEHWQRVFEHAGNRGIKLGMIHWCVMTFGAQNKIPGVMQGIYRDQRDEDTRDYLRQSVEKMVETYPQLAMIGLSPGENDNEHLEGTADSTEAFAYDVYARGMMNGLDSYRATVGNNDRTIDFIFRNHSTEYQDYVEYFEEPWEAANATADAPYGELQASIKYTIGRLYSSRRPLEWERRAYDSDGSWGGWVPEGYRAWMNIRNDDIFLHRWGSPDYVREFVSAMPVDDSPGFVMGSDGYVWGKTFSSTIAGLNGQLEIDKHWYNFRMFGEMGYNNNLDDDYWRDVLANHYGLDAAAAANLFTAWETVSEVVPEINRATFEPADASMAVEGCQRAFNDATGFLGYDELYLGANRPSAAYAYEPMDLISPRLSGEQQMMDTVPWANWQAGDGSRPEGDISILQVANRLDNYADEVSDRLSALRGHAVGNLHYRDLLWDLHSMAELGRYYADKMRTAAKMARYDAEGTNAFRTQAEQHVKDAQAHWVTYAAILDKHYQSQILSRTHYLDWNNTYHSGRELFSFGGTGIRKGILSETESLVGDLSGSNNAPSVNLGGLGGSLDLGSEDVVASASDDHALAYVELFVDGQSVGIDSQAPFEWNAELALFADGGSHDLEVVAVDLFDVSSSDTVTVTINGSTPPVNVPPTVAWTNPTGDISIEGGDNVSLLGTATDSDGTVDQIALFIDGVLEETQSGSTFSDTLAGLTSGVYVLTLVATDDDGAETTSAPRTITVTGPGGVDPNTILSVSLIDADTDTVISGYETILNGDVVTIDLDDHPGVSALSVLANTYAVDLVRFRDEGADELIFVDNTAPFTIAGEVGADVQPWAFTLDTTYSLRLWPNAGGIFGINFDCTLTINDSGTIPVNVPPTVSWTDPTGDVSIEEGDSVTLLGTASDSDGTVDQVALYIDGVLEGTQAGNSFSDTLAGLTSGVYVLTLVATDDDGAETTSATRTITVTSPGGVDPNTVLSVSLIDADTDTVITGYEDIRNGDVVTIDLDDHPGVSALSVRANTYAVDFVRFRDQGAGVNIFSDNSAPYTIAGEMGADIQPWAFTFDTPYLLRVWPRAGGIFGVNFDFTLTVADSGAASNARQISLEVTPDAAEVEHVESGSTDPSPATFSGLDIDQDATFDFTLIGGPG